MAGKNADRGVVTPGPDGMATSKTVTPVKTGVQNRHTILHPLESGLRRNGELLPYRLYYAIMAAIPSGPAATFNTALF